ncbi:MAG TPA: SGNH/GDSL hydrolase family protein [Dermatophilaceae bacterium]
MSDDTQDRRERRTFSRYVAVGDSFTEGMADADPARANAYVGWADRLAAHLACLPLLGGTDQPDRDNQPDRDDTGTFGYANLAVRGRLLADIAGPQVENALALAPDLVSIVGGGNDILRPRADIDALAARLEDAVARLRATGADVLLATPSDPRDAPLIKASRGRAATYTAHIWSIARRHDAHVIDLWGMAALRDWRLWAPDRIHLTSEGHRRVALNAFTALGFTAPDADWSIPLPPAPPISRSDWARANAQWAREYVGPWVQRRLRGQSSGDTVSAKRPTITGI